MSRRLLSGALLATIALAPAAHAQQVGKFEFTIRNMMRGPEVYGRAPSNIRWTLDGQWIYFNWLEPGSDWRLSPVQFRVRATPGAKPERVDVPITDVVFADQGELSPDGSKRLLVNGSAIAVADVRGGTTRILTQTLDAKSGATWSADGKEVLYISENNAFAVSVASSGVRQLSDIRVAGGTGNGGAAGAVAGGRAGGRGGRAGGRGGAAAANTDTTQQGALERQQKELFQVIRDRAWTDSVARAEGRGGAGGRGGGRGGRFGGGGGSDVIPGLDAAVPKAVNLMAGERPAGVSVSPNGQALLVTAMVPASEQAKSTLVPQWVTESGYVEEINGRSKVGDQPFGAARLLWVSLPDGNTQVLRLAGDSPASLRISTSVMGWNETGTHAIVLSTSADFKNRWIYTVNATDGRANLVEALHDSAWVGGPCSRCAGWIDGGKKVYYVSEADGYAHLYTANPDGSDRKQLTQGKWEVTGVELSKDKRSFYLTSSETSVFESHFYRMPVEGGPRVKVTGPVGSHAVTLSPDESMIADVHSKGNRPPELFIGRNEPGAQLSQLTTSPTADWLAFRWITPKIVMLPASDGAQVPAQIYTPADMGARPNGAGVIFVHGAGYLHNVMNYWKGSYSREYMFNHYLASKGYVVLDIDYRGSAGYGRDWRTAIYRWMGGRDLQDQVDGSRYLQRNYGINPERVGIYGGSYGGFITLMALFTEPKWFGAGAALRSVTDWAHYNHGYTGAILNLPQDDSLAYRRSSPIFFAEGLEDPLIMLHGMVDSNVEFQDIVRLTQRLIELGKPNWYLAPYPVENHGFTRPDSWTDEYTRIFNLFESTIRVGSKRLPGTVY